MKISLVVLVAAAVFVGGLFLYRSAQQFPLPEGETVLEESASGGVESSLEDDGNGEARETAILTEESSGAMKSRGESTREIFVTDGVRHSIPLQEILSGGPSKDGIPSIDAPEFVSTGEADDFLSSRDAGLGFVWKGEARFYPYSVLVWHEIVNDTVQGAPVLVTYCPLCATGVVFEREVNGEPQEFGVSGKLWQSNLLMYNRAPNEKEESLWSQVLGEAVLGVHTGMRLKVLPADTVRYGDWKKAHPDTLVLSTATGAVRDYGRDPYEGYYTSRDVSFGATFDDSRLHPKAYVLGIELEGQYKAYHQEALRVGTTEDNFAGRRISIEKNDIGQVKLFVDGELLPYIGGFWFSWLAVHPETELYK